jgi:hydrogenase nickel incorporation protein HypA/HybF
MHELSLCRAVADTVVAHGGGRRVERVRLVVGRFRQVVPDTLVHCWELTTVGSSLEGSVLEVTPVPAVLSCRACGADTPLELPVFRCGACDGVDVHLVSGEEFLVSSIDVASRASTEASR